MANSQSYTLPRPQVLCHLTGPAIKGGCVSAPIWISLSKRISSGAEWRVFLQSW
jgi:hypothetical protein